MNGMQYLCLLFIPFSVSVSDTTLIEKPKLHFFEDCFDTWMILVFKVPLAGVF